MPDGFTGTLRLWAPGFFLPLGMLDRLTARTNGPGDNVLQDRGSDRLSLVGRLKPGFSLANINAPLQVLGERLANAHPRENGQHQLLAAPLARLSHSNRPD